MENEILEYIDDVRTEYPEVVVEDEPFIIQSDPDIEESYIYQEPEEPILAISENKIENIKEFKKMGVIDSESKSDVLIRSSDVINNSNSSESFNIDNYDSTLIWNNLYPDSSFSTVRVDFDVDINDFDLIGIEYKYSTSVNLKSLLIMKVSDFKLLGGGNNNLVGLNNLVNSNTVYSRSLGYTNNGLNIDYCVDLNRLMVNNEYIIPTNVYAYKAKTLSNNIIPDIPNQIVSGNNIYNFYYCTVSDNSVSNNIMTKNINDYTVGESLSLMIFLGLLVAGMVYTIKKSIFKW